MNIIDAKKTTEYVSHEEWLRQARKEAEAYEAKKARRIQELKSSAQ